MTFAMFSEDALAKFRTFCEAANMKAPRPQGAFDQALKPRKESTMSKYRYVPVKGTANGLFTRERSNVMAYDEAGGPNDTDEVHATAEKVIEFLQGKISGEDMNEVRRLLSVDEVQLEQAKKQMAGDRFPPGLRRRLDAAPATTSARGGFDSRFPNAAKIGRDDMIGRR